MKKIGKRFAAIFMAVCLMAGMMPNVVLAAESTAVLTVGIPKQGDSACTGLEAGKYYKTDADGNITDGCRW